jgi:hypothetical protein
MEDSSKLGLEEIDFKETDWVHLVHCYMQYLGLTYFPVS